MLKNYKIIKMRDSAKKQALKDIQKELPTLKHFNDVGQVEILTISASKLNTKKNKFLNKLLGI